MKTSPWRSEEYSDDPADADSKPSVRFSESGNGVIVTVTTATESASTFLDESECLSVCRFLLSVLAGGNE